MGGVNDTNAVLNCMRQFSFFDPKNCSTITRSLEGLTGERELTTLVPVQSPEIDISKKHFCRTLNENDRILFKVHRRYRKNHFFHLSISKNRDIEKKFLERNTKIAHTVQGTSLVPWIPPFNLCDPQKARYPRQIIWK